MLRSNCKAVKTAIRKEIEDTFKVRLDGYDDVPERLQDKARFYISLLRDELSYTVKFTVNGRQNPRYLSDFNRIKYDLDCGVWECGTFDRWNQVKTWLEQTDEEAERYTYEKGDEMWKYLVAREVEALARMK